MKKLLFFTLLTMMIITLIGCSESKKEETNKTSKTQTKKSAPAIPEADKAAQMQEQTGKLPSNFPEDFPIYEGAKIDGNTQSYGTPKHGLMFSVKWIANDDAKKVYEFYKEELHKNGYVVANTEEQSSGTNVILFQEGKGSIIMQPKDKTTLINANFAKVY